MGLSNVIAGAAVFLTGLLPVSCHKVATHAAPQPKTASTVATASAASSVHNLGELTLTNHLETTVQLDASADCTFLPKMLDGHDVKLTLSLESLNPDGKTRDLNVTQVTAKDGKPVQIAVGSFQLSLTPKMVSE